MTIGNWCTGVTLVLMYRKLSLSIIDNFWVIELSVFVAKIIDNTSNISIFEQNTGISTKSKYFFEKFNI
jgi:hypothetical protein